MDAHNVSAMLLALFCHLISSHKHIRTPFTFHHIYASAYLKSITFLPLELEPFCKLSVNDPMNQRRFLMIAYTPLLAKMSLRLSQKSQNAYTFFIS